MYSDNGLPQFVVGPVDRTEENYTRKLVITTIPTNTQTHYTSQ